MIFVRILLFTVVLMTCAPAQAEPCPGFQTTMLDIETTLDAIDAAKRP